MISHHLTQIYQQQILNESSIPDDVRQAMYYKMDSTNQIFYRYAADIFTMMSDKPLPENLLNNASAVGLEYACKYALKLYDNIDVVATKVFQEALDSLEVIAAGKSNYISWWAYTRTVADYIKYRHRFGKDYDVARKFILQLLHPSNVDIFINIEAWDAINSVIGAFLNESMHLEEQVGLLIQQQVQKRHIIDDRSLYLIASYYRHCTRVAQEPCKWIDDLMCSADRSDAERIFRKVGYMRNSIMTGEQRRIYDLNDFLRLVCRKIKANEEPYAEL